jgi:hypothetical protein
MIPGALFFPRIRCSSFILFILVFSCGTIFTKSSFDGCILGGVHGRLELSISKNQLDRDDELQRWDILDLNG